MKFPFLGVIPVFFFFSKFNFPCYHGVSVYYGNCFGVFIIVVISGFYVIILSDFFFFLSLFMIFILSLLMIFILALSLLFHVSLLVFSTYLYPTFLPLSSYLLFMALSFF